MPNPEKEEKVKQLTKKLSDSKGVFLTDFTGLNVEAINDLRNKFREANVSYQVVKNTLLEISLKEAGISEKALDSLIGPTAIAFGADDPIAPARVLNEYLKTSDKPIIKGCLIEDQFYEGSELSVIAKMKSKNELIADILGLISAPLPNLLGSLQSVGIRLAGALKELTEKSDSKE